MEYSQEYNEYLLKPSKMRRFIRKIYLNDIKRHLIGATLDFGCGTGELLKMLPEGSIGFEINPYSVEFCQKNGLDVSLYDLDDNYQLSFIKNRGLQSFTMNHVLEHTENPAEVINLLFKTCQRLGISTIVFTVPGIKGFKSDKTHLTFVNDEYLSKEGIYNSDLFKLEKKYYFPINSYKFSKYFTHNELRLVFKQVF